MVQIFKDKQQLSTSSVRVTRQTPGPETPVTPAPAPAGSGQSQSACPRSQITPGEVGYFVMIEHEDGTSECGIKLFSGDQIIVLP